jgi:AGZA family xanthine/uracil permease-like MFS transporter
MLDRFFGLSKYGTSVRTELLAGLTTFLTMAYIIFVQPEVLSGGLGSPTGMDFGAVTVATCLSAALASAIMGLYGRYPIAQAPGMGENFFFVVCLLPTATAMIDAEVHAGRLAADATTAWQIGLGVVFISGVLFLAFSLVGLRKILLETISPSMRLAIAGGIGLFVAFVGLRNAKVVLLSHDSIAMNYNFASPDMLIFFFGLLLMSGLFALRVRGSIFWGILAATALAVILKLGLAGAPESVQQFEVIKNSALMNRFTIVEQVVSMPPSMAPTFFQMDLVHAATWKMAPFILIFLFMVVFDTMGTLVGVAEQAGLIEDNKLPRAKQAFVSDAVGTIAGAAFGTSTVTSFIESTAGVEQGGRTGLTALTAAALFLLALFFSPVIAMVGSYPAITAPALVIVGSMMMRGISKITWDNAAEAIPAFLTIIGIPLTYSIADGLALGFISYPVVKLLAGQGRDVKWLMYVVAAVLVAYFVAIRAPVG